MNATTILAHWERVLLPLLKDVEVQGDELIARNPRREDGHLGSFRLSLRTGRWADFAMEGVRGKSPVSLIGYLLDLTPDQARHWVTRRVRELGLNGASAAETILPAQEPESEAVLPVPEGAPALPSPDRFGYATGEWCYRDKDGALLCVVRRYDDKGKKVIRCWTYRSTGRWEPKKPGKPWALFNLDQLAKDPAALVLLAEGEKTAVAACALGGVGTTVMNGSTGVEHADLAPLTDRDVVLLPDADEPGRRYALDLIQRLQGTTRSLRIVDVWSLGWKDGEDVADHPELTPEWVHMQSLQVADWLSDHPEEKDRVETKQGVDRLKARVEELARLDPMEFEVRRTAEAEALGVRASMLDSWVQQQREALAPSQDGAGQSLMLVDPEPWPEPVDGAVLAQELEAVFTRHLVLPPGGPEVLVLWTFHTHAFAAADFSPHLMVISPLKRSGKSTVLRILQEVCSKALAVEHCTVSALFRSVERAQPTLLLDEADGYVAQDELLRGLLNSSFQRGGGVLRVEGEEREPRFFATFTPTAIASIKDLPATIMDRAVVLRMKRKSSEEKVEKFRRPARSACFPLKRRLVRWAQDNAGTLANTTLCIPESLNDREADFWEPLVQIAVRLGPDWEKRALKTALVLQGEEAADSVDSGLELLEDVRILVLPRQLERFTSEWLRYELGTLEGRPWSTFTDRGLISQLDLSKALRPFGIKPKQMRVDAGTAHRPEQTKENYKGYTLAQFTDAWTRYLGEFVRAHEEDPSPPLSLPCRRLHPLHRLQNGKTGAPKAGDGGNVDPPCENVDPPSENEDCADRLQNPQTGAEPGVKTVFVDGVEGVDVYREEIEGDVSPDARARADTRVAIRYLTDPEDARTALAEMIAAGKTLGADTETTGLDPRKAKLRLFQVTDGETVLVLDLLKMGVPAREVRAPLEGASLVFHNVQFDFSFLLAVGIRPKELHCTQLAYALLTHDPMISLAKACQEVLGVAVPKELQRSDWALPELSQDQIHYAARDAVLTLDLYTALSARIKAARMVRAHALVQRCIPAIGDAQARGVLLDRAKHGALVERWTGERETALTDLRAVLGEGVNPESPVQLSRWLSENLDAETRASWPMTGKGQLATDKDSLEAFADVPLVRPLLDYRRVSHRLKTWGEAYQRHVTPQGRIHPGFLLLGARSGRMSCRNPNVQNLPRDPALRACFIAPEGHVLLAADFSQIELRIAGLLSDDPVILAAYREGKDLHREIVARVTGKAVDEITPQERKLGKALNFGLLYGAGPPTFRTRAQVDYGISLSLEDAARFKAIFDQTYSKLRWWQMEQQRQGERTGRMRTVSGRVIAFRDPENVYTDSRNYPVQSAAADLQLLAIQRAHAALRDFPAYLINFVHDELVLEVREDAVDKVSRLVEEQMTRAFRDLFKGYPEAGAIAHHSVEVGTGPNYAGVK